jgi:hypothetical protein
MNVRMLLIQLVITILLFLIIMLLLKICAKLRRKRNSGNRNRKESPRPCATVTPQVYRRPDPMIYDQYYLMKQGIAVTWNNPDIHLELGGLIVSSGSIVKSTKYDIVARIWNGSTDAPAVKLPVRFSYLNFGIGQKHVPIGEALVDLPVKGAPGCPTFAKMEWTTPATPGHYCLQVELIWSDDANPDNNLGQENLNVKALNSPHANFTFPVRNDTAVRQVLLLEADTYSVPARRPCPDENHDRRKPPPANDFPLRLEEAQALHNRRNHPLPAGWRVDIQPNEFVLAPDTEQQVSVDITAIDGFAGEQAVNILAFDVFLSRSNPKLTGGVSLIVTGTG